MALVNDSAVLNPGLYTHITWDGKGEVPPRPTESSLWASRPLGGQDLEICICYEAA